MNWKEQPSLFHGFEVETERKQKLPIVGATLDNKRLILQASNVQFHCDINNCQLIARPIKDITDEEMEELWGRTYSYHFSRDQLCEDIENYVLKSHVMLDLLSIGVYPFDQDDEDVIFKPKQS